MEDLGLAYVYDGSFEGFLSAVFLAYERRECPADVVGAEQYAPRLGQACVSVATDMGHAMRVRAGIERTMTGVWTINIPFDDLDAWKKAVEEQGTILGFKQD